MSAVVHVVSMQGVHVICIDSTRTPPTGLLLLKGGAGAAMVEPGAPHSEVRLPSAARSRCQPPAFPHISCALSGRGLS